MNFSTANVKLRITKLLFTLGLGYALLDIHLEEEDEAD